MRVLSLIFFCIVLMFHHSYGQTCTINTTQTNVNCNGASTGSASVSVTGGSGGGSNNCVSPQSPGSSDNCSTGCTSTISTNANVTVSSGQKVCITAGSYTGQIQLDGGTAVICGSGTTPSIIFNGGALVITGSATISSINNWSSAASSITNYGTLTFSSATSLEVGFNNHGTTNIAGGLTMGFGSSGFTNTGTLNISSGNLVFDNNGTAVNSNTISITSGTLLVDYSKAFTNNCTLTVGSTLTNHGTFVNSGPVTVGGFISDGGSFTNNSIVTISGSTNFSGGTISIAAGSEITTTNFELSIAVNGTGTSCASIKTSGNTTFNWGAAFTGQARYCDLDGTIESNTPNVTTNVSLTTCSCNVSAPVCTYSWKNSANTEIATTQNAASLAAGTYTVTATCSGCANSPLSSSVTITEPAALSFTTAKTDISCNGSSDGSITVTPSGGTGTKEYSKDNGVTYQSGNIFTGLSSGTYSIKVKDVNNCVTSAQEVTIGTPSVLSATVSKTDVNCNGNSDGTITVTASGGTDALQYSKDNGATYQSGNIFSGLSAGTYLVVVKDASNCTTTAQDIIITVPTALAASYTKTDPGCAGSSNGSINLTVSGGTTPYTYLWSNAATTQNLTGLAAGNYSVSVTDFKSCTTSLSVTLTEPAAIDITVTKTDISVFGANDGTASLTINNTGPGGTLAANNCSTSSPQDCASGCTSTYSSNSGTITISSTTDKICLTATNYTGTINFNAAGTLVICGNASPSSMNINSGAIVIVSASGSLTVPSLDINNPSILENYGTITVNGNMSNNSTVLNGKTLIITGDFSDNGGAVLTNLCTMSVGNNLYNNGTIHNRGKITTVNLTTLNGGSLITMDNGSELITGSLTLNGSIQGPASGTCSSLKINGTTTINGGATFSGQVSLCDANGVETNNASGLSGFLNCNCTLTDPNCSVSWSNGSTADSLFNLTPGQYTVTVTCGGCSTSQTIEIIQTADLTVNTAYVNPGNFTLSAPGITTLNAQSGTPASELTISPTLPTTSIPNSIILIVDKTAGSDSLEIRISYNAQSEPVSARVKQGSEIIPMNQDYYQIEGRKITFYNEKPKKAELQITTNLKNGIKLDPQLKTLIVSLPVTGLITASSLSVYKLEQGSASQVQAPSSTLSWDGSTAATGVYEFRLVLTGSSGAKEFKGQFVIE